MKEINTENEKYIISDELNIEPNFDSFYEDNTQVHNEPVKKYLSDKSVYIAKITVKFNYELKILGILKSITKSSKICSITISVLEEQIFPIIDFPTISSSLENFSILYKDKEIELYKKDSKFYLSKIEILEIINGSAICKLDFAR